MTATEVLELYRKAVQSIALNDDPTELSVPLVQSYISVQIVADIFSRSPRTVARAVVEFRKQQQGSEHGLDR